MVACAVAGENFENRPPFFILYFPAIPRYVSEHNLALVSRTSDLLSFVMYENLFTAN